MDKLTFSRYFQEEYFPISVTLMTASGVATKTPLHTHEFSELVYVAEGSILHQTSTDRTRLQKGDFFLIHPGMAHSYSTPEKELRLYNLIYDASVPVPMLMMGNLPFIEQVYPQDKTLPFSGLPAIFNVAGRNRPGIVEALEQIRKEVKKRGPGDHILVLSLFMEIIVRLAREYSNVNQTKSDWTLDRAIAYLKCNYTEKIEMGKLAKMLGMSEKTLQRRFQSIFGVSPSEYLTDLRLRQAVLLLKNRNIKLNTVAEECGFCDSSHLWKSLKRKLNLTPGEIRKKKKSEAKKSRQAVEPK